MSEGNVRAGGEKNKPPSFTVAMFFQLSTYKSAVHPSEAPNFTSIAILSLHFQGGLSIWPEKGFIENQREPILNSSVIRVMHT